MYDEYEIKGLHIGYTIEYQHGLYREMPGTGTIGCRYDDGDGAHDKSDEGTTGSQVLREVETEEGQVIVQEVAHPDSQREADKKWDVTYSFQGDDTLPDAVDGGLHLIIE